MAIEVTMKDIGWKWACKGKYVNQFRDAWIVKQKDGSWKGAYIGLRGVTYRGGFETKEQAIHFVERNT